MSSCQKEKRMGIVDKKLSELGIEVPPVSLNPSLLFVPAVIVNNLLYTAGAVPASGDGTRRYSGHVGKDLDVAEAREAARLCAINLISFIKYGLGDLDRVKRVVSLTGWVNSAPGFNRQPEVLNGASEVFLQVWGEAGKHVRTALSTNELGSDACVECNVIVELKG
jgi:enamine deaminase RidA (YjgF/YER057c/UK114 family)